MKIAIYHSPYNIYNNVSYINTLINKLIYKDISVLLHENFLPIISKINNASSINVFSDKDSLQNNKADMLISLGGDGTFLSTLLVVQDSQIPVLGINLGRLGFISNINKEETDKIIECILNKKYEIKHRSLLKINSASNYFGAFNYALNDFIVKKSRNNSMLNLKVSINGRWLNNYWGDGIIVSTPTGSTAYSISCGGPIILPDTNNFIITPICPHNLSVRPVVVSDSSTIDIEVKTDRVSTITLSLDSRNIETKPTEIFSIEKQHFTLAIMQPIFYDYLNTLRDKLMWGLDYRN